MKKSVGRQLRDKEYAEFGQLFRCQDSEELSYKLYSVLQNRLNNEEIADKVVASINSVFEDHLKAVKFFLCFYQSDEIEDVDKAKEMKQNRIRLEKKFDNKLKYFQNIYNKCNEHRKHIETITYRIKSDRQNREEYQLHAPSQLLKEKDIEALEKFLHWDVFLSNFDDEDSRNGQSHLHAQSSSNLGAGGLHVEAKEYNRELAMRLIPILSYTNFSGRKKAIIVWAHQYLASKLFKAMGESHIEQHYIPSLSSLTHDINKIISKTK